MNEELKTQSLYSSLNLHLTTKPFILHGATFLFDSCMGKILEQVDTNGVHHYRSFSPHQLIKDGSHRLTVQALVCSFSMTDRTQAKVFVADPFNK